jgi:hypothetical protein|tara:strand:- start:1003 stop:1257 length:255 start_codon:yes stop_codon:yes gene_type:complete
MSQNPNKQPILEGRAEIGKRISDLQKKKRDVGNKKSELSRSYNSEQNPQKKRLKALQIQELAMRLQLFSIKEKQLVIKKGMAKS